MGMTVQVIEAALLRSVVRRHGWRSLMIDLGYIELDLKQCLAMAGERVVRLRPAEYRLLEALALRAGRLVSREHLLALMYAGDSAPKPRTLDTLVAGVRCVLVHPDHLQPLVTRQPGFCLERRSPAAKAARGIIIAQDLPPADWQIEDYDWMMCGGDPAAAVERARMENPYDAIVVVAARDTATLLRAGADAVLSAEAAPSEVAAVLARLKTKAPDRRTMLAVRDISLDINSGSTTCRGEALLLTPSETRILALLLDRPGGIITRSNVVEQLYQGRGSPALATVDAHVRALRRKLDRARSTADIQILGQSSGYRLAAR
jgi:DNA-binding response OmpR family regulator